MELNFQKAGHDYYEPLRFTPFTCETMRENIVPLKGVRTSTPYAFSRGNEE